MRPRLASCDLANDRFCVLLPPKKTRKNKSVCVFFAWLQKKSQKSSAFFHRKKRTNRFNQSVRSSAFDRRLLATKMARQAKPCLLPRESLLVKLTHANPNRRAQILQDALEKKETVEDFAACLKTCLEEQRCKICLCALRVKCLLPSMLLESLKLCWEMDRGRLLREAATTLVLEDALFRDALAQCREIERAELSALAPVRTPLTYIVETKRSPEFKRRRYDISNATPVTTKQTDAAQDQMQTVCLHEQKIACDQDDCCERKVWNETWNRAETTFYRRTRCAMCNDVYFIEFRRACEPAWNEMLPLFCPHPRGALQVDVRSHHQDNPYQAHPPLKQKEHPVLFYPTAKRCFGQATCVLCETQRLSVVCYGYIDMRDEQNDMVWSAWEVWRELAS